MLKFCLLELQSRFYGFSIAFFARIYAQVNQMPDSSMAGAGSPPPPPRNSSVDHELGQRKDAIIEQLLKELEVAR